MHIRICLQTLGRSFVEIVLTRLHRTLVLTTLAVAVLWLSITFSAMKESQHATEQHEAELNETLAISLATHVGESIKYADQILTKNRDVFLSHPEALGHTLLENNTRVDRLRYPLEGLIGPNGRQIISATQAGISTKPIDLSDRPHFRFHADHPKPHNDDIFIGEVMVGRISGKPVIQISRGFRDQSHKLLGVGVISIDPAVLVQDHLVLAKNHWIISIIGTDKLGRIRIGEAFTQYSIDYSGSETIHRILEVGQGHLKASSSLDGKNHIYGFSKIPKLPLVVTVSSGTKDAWGNYYAPGTPIVIPILLITSLAWMLIMAIWMQHLTTKLQFSNEKLANNVAQVERANKAQRQLTASISHEIRTPLHGIIGHAQLLNLNASADKQQRESSLAIFNAAKYLRTIVGQLLDLGRIEAGTEILSFKMENLETLIDDVCHLHRASAVTSELEFSTNLNDITGVFIETDQLALKRCLHNLISNAIKFTSKGKVTVEAVRGPDETVHIRVRDSGIGIAPEHFDQVFKQYTQLSKNVKFNLFGTGLGCALSKHLTELLKGELTFISQLGSGSTFTMTLPLRNSASNTSPAGAYPTHA